MCPKSWHSVLKRKKKAQMSFHQRTYLCGKKKSGGRDRKSQRHHIPVCSNWALLQTFFVSDRMESRLSQVFRPRLVLQILSNSVFTLLSLNYQNINIILYLITTNFISWVSRTSFRILRKGKGITAEMWMWAPFGRFLWIQCPLLWSSYTISSVISLELTFEQLLKELFEDLDM